MNTIARSNVPTLFHRHNYSRLLTGFTLLESLVTVLIVATVSTLALTNYRSAQQGLKLRQAAAELTATLREAQQHALSGTAVGGSVPAGFGVHFEDTTTTYRLFTDSGDGVYKVSDDTDLTLHKLPSGVSFGLAINDPAATPGCDNANLNTIDVVFQPPVPIASVKKNPGVSCGYACVFTQLGSQKWRTVVTRATGVIETTAGGTTCP
jgi:prepilin-type N-terminal cleavage/methylation domain-containing protein